MDNRIHVAVVDDHPLFRDGVIHTLAAHEDLTVIGQGATAADAMRIARDARPDVMVLDLSLPGDGIAALGTIAAECPAVNVLMLTVIADEERVAEAMRLGARGYLVKGASGSELVAAVRAIHEGELHVSPSVAARLVRRIAPPPASREAAMDRMAELTCRELEILKLVSRGMSNKEIGSTLVLTEKTVKHYLTSVLKKLRVRNRVEAALLGSSRYADAMAGAGGAELARVREARSVSRGGRLSVWRR
jgi:DNA-binding NarL/FixJ family response regulator